MGKVAATAPCFAPKPTRKDRMLSLRYALGLFACYFVVLALYGRVYLRPRLYLVLLGESSFMDQYIERLPHMLDRPDERLAMVAFLRDKRRGFLRGGLLFVLSATLLYLLLLCLGAA
jgi:hypothetical protein